MSVQVELGETLCASCIELFLLSIQPCTCFVRYFFSHDCSYCDCGCLSFSLIDVWKYSITIWLWIARCMGRWNQVLLINLIVSPWKMARHRDVSSTYVYISISITITSIIWIRSCRSKVKILKPVIECVFYGWCFINASMIFPFSYL